MLAIYHDRINLREVFSPVKGLLRETKGTYAFTRTLARFQAPVNELKVNW